MQIILFNGPPGSGKDRIADELQSSLSQIGRIAIKYKFAGCMKMALRGFFNLTDEEYFHYFETDAKNHPQDKFLGKTPRAALISFSEAWVKLYFGPKTFGQLAGQAVKGFEKDFDGQDFVLISDCGFEEELEGLFEYVKPKDCVIYRLQRDNTSYENDSRNWIMNDSVRFNKTLDNNRNVEDVISEILTDLKVK